MNSGRRLSRPRLALTVIAALGLLGGLTTQFRHRLPIEVAETLGLRRSLVELRAEQLPRLTADLARKGLTPGAPLYIRIFKEDARLDLHVLDGPRYRLFRSYPICAYSGNLGPKLREGDGQSPEGFYAVASDALNPASRYHLSFNLGFPNAFDRAQGRTGSFLMVHGDCVSIGCYAMTDPQIEEIYLLVEAALKAGQSDVPIHIFPFEMTPARLAATQSSPWHGFWQQLAPAYQQFNETGLPPVIGIENGLYKVHPTTIDAL